jgi:hypothetical protein
VSPSVIEAIERLNLLTDFLQWLRDTGALTCEPSDEWIDAFMDSRP